MTWFSNFLNKKELAPVVPTIKVVEPQPLVELEEELFQRLKHGDLAHQDWLKEELRRWAKGEKPQGPLTENRDPIQDIHQLLVLFADFFVGVRETPSNKGPEVEMFQRVIGAADGAPWCMSAVQWIVLRVSRRYNLIHNLYPSERCLTVWQQTKEIYKFNSPSVGSVVIWRHGNTSDGHAGIVKAISTDNKIVTLEGNTSAGPGFVTNGDGYYEKVRSLNGDGDLKILGFIRPFGGSRLV